MTSPATSMTLLSDTALVAEVTRLAGCERQIAAQFIMALAELDARRLYLGQGFSSTFTYCTLRLRLSEHAAYNRIEAARAARRFPVILEQIADGSITLTTICLLAAHLTPENHVDVLGAARHKSKRDVEVLVSSLRPRPPVPSSVRKLPAARVELPPAASTVTPPLPESPSAVSESVPSSMAEPDVLATPLSVERRPAHPAVVAPLTPEEYKVQVTVGRDTIDKLRRVQDLMRHVVPDGDPAVILDRALAVLLAQLERTKLAATVRPQTGREPSLGSRHVSAAVRRVVWARDGHQCAFVGADGCRCQERGFLELHHTAPYAAGGEATVETIELRCRAHNLYEAELDFGPAVRERRRIPRQSPLRPPGSRQLSFVNPT